MIFIILCRFLCEFPATFHFIKRTRIYPDLLIWTGSATLFNTFPSLRMYYLLNSFPFGYGNP